jgi:hypothetical protein
MKFGEKEDPFIARSASPRFLLFLKSKTTGLRELRAKDSYVAEVGIMILSAAVLFSIGVLVFHAFRS